MAADPTYRLKIRHKLVAHAIEVEWTTPSPDRREDNTLVQVEGLASNRCRTETVEAAVSAALAYVFGTRSGLPDTGT